MKQPTQIAESSSQDIESNPLQYKTANDLEYRDYRALMKIAPVKKNAAPENHLSLNLVPKKEAPYTYSKTYSSQTIQMKDTGLNNIGEAPEKIKTGGLKKFNTQSFTYSDRTQDPNRFLFKYYQDPASPSKGKQGVSTALKKIHEQYPESNKSMPTSSHQTTRSDALNHFSDTSKETKAEKIASKKHISPKQSSIKELVNWWPESQSKSNVKLERPRINSGNNLEIPVTRIQLKPKDRVPKSATTRPASAKKASKKTKEAKTLTIEKKTDSAVGTLEMKRANSAHSDNLTDLEGQSPLLKIEGRSPLTAGPFRINYAKEDSGERVREEDEDSMPSLVDLARPNEAETQHEQEKEEQKEQIESESKTAAPEKGMLGKAKNLPMKKGFQSQMNSNYGLSKKLSLKVPVSKTENLKSSKNTLKVAKPEEKRQLTLTISSKASVTQKK
jgi:hypothetical protein